MIADSRFDNVEELSWDQRLLRNATRKAELKPEYQ